MLSVGRTQLLLSLLGPKPSSGPYPLQPCQTCSLHSTGDQHQNAPFGGRCIRGEGPSSLKPQAQLLLKIHFCQCQHHITCIRLEAVLPIASPLLLCEN